MSTIPSISNPPASMSMPVAISLASMCTSSISLDVIGIYMGAYICIGRLNCSQSSRRGRRSWEVTEGAFGSRRWMQQIGKLGGSSRSSVEAEASRENGKRGGRPKEGVAERISPPFLKRVVAKLEQEFGLASEP
jgi:hypothetical protein